ncbi:MAG: protein-glutamate methylesterase/protein-glutamine glutaminase [Maritimibacter sp.]
MDEIRVLIVDDSATMRRLIRSGIERDPSIKVVGEAGTAKEARDAVKSMALDVMTLDVEMPGMNGIEFLERLMRSRPMPVVMISSLTKKGSDAAIRALSIGAVECIEKPRFGGARDTFAHVVDTLKIAAQARVQNRKVASPLGRSREVPSAAAFPWNGKYVLIGASTGGVEALETVLSEFPEDCPPTMITQHMPASFLRSFATRLNAAVAPKVRIAKEGDTLAVGQVLLAPGDLTHMCLNGAKCESISLVEGAKTSGHRPSVDELFRSAHPIAENVVAALLTGMGRDGAQGMLELRQAGAYCIGQDAKSSVVYGMPRIAKELGGVDEECALANIGAALLRRASHNRHEGGRILA